MVYGTKSLELSSIAVELERVMPLPGRPAIDIICKSILGFIQAKM